MNVVPVTDSGEPFSAIRFGEAGVKMLQGMRRAVRTMAESGNNIILDDIILEAEFLWDYLDVFDGLEVIFVGVLCPIDVINEREAARPGRFPGTALGHIDICHAHDDYDIQVDTSTTSPQQCASMVLGFLDTGEPGAFSRIRVKRAG
jgi:chloramphenicol 3-O phosphotransferase